MTTPGLGEKGRFLADTHLLIWFVEGNERFPSAVRLLLEEPGNTFFFSVESLREIVIKNSLGKSDFRVDAKAIRTELLRSGWMELPTRSEHVFTLAELPPFHRDPFDRMLVAQAKVEKLTLLTVDETLEQYLVQVIRL